MMSRNERDYRMKKALITGNEVKHQSVLFGEKVNKDVAIVYSPLNGTGKVPCRPSSGNESGL
mgnify:CR=1 FL=1